MSAQHEWERDLRSWHDARGPESDGEDDIDYADVSKEDATAELADLIVDLKFKGILTAKHACVLCFWCKNAGVQSGLIDKLAVRPNEQSGRFSTRFNKVLGIESDEDSDPFYNMDVVGFNRAQAMRYTQSVPMWPPHEALDEELRTMPDMPTRLTAAVAAGDLPPKYFTHQIVRDNDSGAPVYPLAFYVDAVDFMRTDGVLGFWVLSLVSGIRHLCCVLRKSEMCHCGCRGWDTIISVMMAFSWSFRALATGRLPTSRHDHSPWTESDGGREVVGGTLLEYKAVCLFFKNDLMENITTYGFPSWMDLNDPCCLCHCTADTMYQVMGLSLAALPWDAKSFDDYQAACAACEKWVTIPDEETYKLVRATLEYDKANNGNRGRCLLADIPTLALRKGDRLEPHPHMTDVGEFDQMPGPVRRVLFWRRANETAVRRRNPLFSSETGITPLSCFVPDWLHALSLGVYKQFISYFFHALINANAFDIVAHHHEVRVRDSVAVIRELLFAWYDTESSAGRERGRVQNLTAEMVGNSPAHALGTWGHETNGLLEFCPILWERCGARLPLDEGPHYDHGLKTLLAVHKFITTYKTTDPPLAAKQDA